MKRKVVIVALVMWVVCAVGGGLWGRFEQYLHTRSIPPGQLEVQNLKDLYEAKLFDEVLGECDRAEHDVRFAAYEPQILYVRWATDRRTGRTDQADRVQQAFLERFPDHVLAADMHFSTAMNLLAAADYKGAEGELALIRDRYPSAAVSAKAGDILGRLRATSPTTTAAR
jgi:hypothetical protein